MARGEREWKRGSFVQGEAGTNVMRENGSMMMTYCPPPIRTDLTLSPPSDGIKPEYFPRKPATGALPPTAPLGWKDGRGRDGGYRCYWWCVKSLTRPYYSNDTNLCVPGFATNQYFNVPCSLCRYIRRQPTPLLYLIHSLIDLSGILEYPIHASAYTQEVLTILQLCASTKG